MGVADEGEESPFTPAVSPPATSGISGDPEKPAQKRADPPGKVSPMRDSADTILRKLARDALANRPADRAGEKSEPENLTGKMARRLIQLNFKASAKSRRSRDELPPAASK